MSRRMSRRYFLDASVATASVALTACVQPAPPAAPTNSAEGQPAATRPPAVTITTSSAAESKGPVSPLAVNVQATGRATSKAPADKRDLVIATPADLSKLDPHMS